MFGLRARLGNITQQVSDVIDSCVVEALQYPAGKRARTGYYIPAQNQAVLIVSATLPPGTSESFEHLEKVAVVVGP